MSLPTCRFYRIDLAREPLDNFVSQGEVIFHLAGLSNLETGWNDPEMTWGANVLLTQHLLEAVRRSGNQLNRFLYASSSAVYGRFACGDETLPTQPISPLGISKLAGENLCQAYAKVHGLPTVILRYFSVYGPRQRPDQAYHRFIQALLEDQSLIIHGDGHQLRGSTFVADCVQATLAAMKAAPGTIYNVGGGEVANLWDVLRRLEALAGHPAKIQREPARPGDQRHTCPDTTRLRTDLGWQPEVSLTKGLALQWIWQAGQVGASSFFYQPPHGPALRQANRQGAGVGN